MKSVDEVLKMEFTRRLTIGESVSKETDHLRPLLKKISNSAQEKLEPYVRASQSELAFPLLKQEASHKKGCRRVRPRLQSGPHRIQWIDLSCFCGEVRNTMKFNVPTQRIFGGIGDRTHNLPTLQSTPLV
ncbi:hypothetical protein AVEN_144655-1, partial [Araneus ventricosus]